MTHFRKAMLASALLLAGAPVIAQPAAQGGGGKEASIPFVDQRGIRDWQAVSDDQIYVQASGGQWYLATLMTGAPDLPFAQSIGFETKGLDRLDRFGAIVVAGTRYPLKSLVESGPPPKKK
ncbi:MULTISPECIES: DUF6491 family protein [unclassified Sphingobium]|uniref:DUF6491 family protein n=1 Tax=unclassified Sphingobium TaxID=2611147 RepID=UPI0022252840|nr:MULTISPECIES: DUF6491 family protein [unclassified Sphingobium]MCW2395265.1 hypothetical protein [Sphingobium sp. B8D3B]MCW2418779.1 hypothetical protein [Sphingobium sp. B8D3C]